MKLKSILVAWDFIFASIVTATCTVLLPHWVKNDFAKDLYGVGISVLSIVFSVFFAALAIIMASSDDEFVKFLEVEGDYTRLISSMRFTLTVLFASLVVALFLYSYSSYRISEKIEDQKFLWLTIFAFLFSYSLGASLGATTDAIRYSGYRSKFLRLPRGKQD
jgi:hypothetical protein